MSKLDKTEDDAPLNRNSFAAEFCHAGSTIVHADRFSDHARQILADEENYLGLFALDLMLKNKQGQYRKDEITPKANHPLLVFFQFHIFHQNDKDNPQRTWKYLPDRPDLDKVLALLHDEGEDHYKHKPDDIIEMFRTFIDDIDGYIEQLNKNYSGIDLRKPTEKEKDKMLKEMKDLLSTSYDCLQKTYKGDFWDRAKYYLYHKIVAEDARASRVKVVDKACNAATFVYRDRKLAALVPDGLDWTKYREWVQNQRARLSDIYFIQPFDLKDNFSKKKGKLAAGFMDVVRKKHPQNQRFFSVMRGILKTQLDLYDHNLANERIDHGSPILRRRSTTYDKICFAKSINLIDILINRLDEVKKIDAEKEMRDPGKGLFGIPFAKTYG